MAEIAESNPTWSMAYVFGADGRDVECVECRKPFEIVFEGWVDHEKKPKKGAVRSTVLQARQVGVRCGCGLWDAPDSDAVPKEIEVTHGDT